MHWSQLAILLRIDISETEHVIEAVLFLRIKPTLRDRLPGILIGAKQDVPERNIGVVIRVMVALVVHSV